MARSFDTSREAVPPIKIPVNYPTLHMWPLGYVAGRCREITTLARCGNEKNVYRNACVTYEKKLDCETSCREVCITCDVGVRFVDVLATFV